MEVKAFKGPARYAVYGGKREQGFARITGCETITDCEVAIENHARSYPGCEYQIWEAQWREVKR